MKTKTICVPIYYIKPFPKSKKILIDSDAMMIEFIQKLNQLKRNTNV